MKFLLQIYKNNLQTKVPILIHLGEPSTGCTKIDWCASSPCQNGGNCSDNTSNFSCSCPSGFQGDLCESDIAECSALPCMNQGTCVELSGSFSCDCPAGYTGNVCQADVDECLASPCKRGSCSNLVSCTAFTLTVGSRLSRD